MSNYPALKPKEIVKILNKMGFVFFRQKGSHQIYVKDEKMVIVPMHNKTLKKGTQNNIIKGMGLTLEEFYSFM